MKLWVIPTAGMLLLIVYLVFIEDNDGKEGDSSVSHPGIGNSVGEGESDLSPNGTSDSGTDWDAVGLIASLHQPALIELSARRSELLKAIQDIRAGHGRYPKDENQGYYDIKAELKVLEKDIRDKERELWGEVAEVMSYTDLRKFKLDNSMTGKRIKEETEWFQPTEAELDTLYTAEETLYDFIDRQFDGDVSEYARLWEAGRDRMNQKVDEMVDQGLSLEEAFEISESLQGPDIDARRFLEAHLRYIAERFTPERHRELNLGNDPVRAAVVNKALEYLNGLELLRTGQISGEEYEKILMNHIDTMIDLPDPSNVNLPANPSDNP